MKKSGYGLSVLLVLLGASSYGFMSPLVKQTYAAGFTFEEITVHQVGMGTLLLWLIVLFRRSARHNPFSGPWLKLVSTGLFGMALTTIFYNMALERIEASLAIVLLFQFTWITILIDSIWNRRLPGRWSWVSIAIVLAGTVLAVGITGAGIGHIDPLGTIWGLLSALSYSLFLWLTGRIKYDGDPALRSAIVTTAAFALIVSLYGSHAWAGADEMSMAGIGIVLGLLGQVIPTLLFTIGIPTIGSNLASMLGAAELPVAVVAAWLIAGESIGTMQALGIVLILCGIVLAERRSGGQPRKAPRLGE